MIQVVFFVFLALYGFLIVTRFYQYPFINEGRDYEICIILYIGGLVIEEALQAGPLFVVYLYAMFVQQSVMWLLADMT